MTLKRNGFWSIALLVVLAAGLSAQTPAQSGQTPTPAKPAAPAQHEKPTFRMQVDLVTNDVVVSDDKGTFVPALTKAVFTIIEYGDQQELKSVTDVHGG